MLISAIAFLSPAVYAKTLFPILELGNCRDVQECFYYCEIPRNKAACWSYGEYVLHKGVLSDQTINPDEGARRHGITFPIAELGNCASAQECMAYCNKPENHDACSAFGEKKGLLQGNTSQINQERLLSDAKNILGCDSKSSCSTFCRNPVNQQKCQEFFQKEGLTTQSPTKPSCSSPDSCREFCSNPVNKQTCDAFGTSCLNFCKGNPDKCPYLNTQSLHPVPPISITSPNGLPAAISGCSNKEECYTYCQNNPGRCPGFPERPVPTYYQSQTVYPNASGSSSPSQ